MDEEDDATARNQNEINNNAKPSNSSEKWKIQLGFRGIEPDVNRTRNLLIWSQTRYHCATDPFGESEITKF